VTSVKVPTAEGYEEYETEADVITHVSINLSDQLCLAFAAPCCNGPLFDDIGFMGDSEAVLQILEGTYNYSSRTDPAIQLLLEEAAITYSKLSADEISAYVTAEDFQYYWQTANERILSSYSGLHFGHYKAASWDNDLSALHALKLSLSLAAKSDIPLK